jgi:O-antigen ligase
VQSEYFSLNRVPGGTFGNRNFVAHLAAIGAPVVALSALTAKRGATSVIGGIGMMILSATLVLSRSRAAWLAIIALAIPVGILAYLTRERWTDTRTERRLAVLIVSTAIGVAAALVLPNRLEWKSDSPYLDSAAGLVNYKGGSGRGRLVQYTNSLHMTEAHPIIGVGPGNWAVAYPKYASRNDPSMSQEDGVTSNPWPSSDWIAYLSERGVVGFALLVATMLALLGRAVRELRTPEGHNPERVLTALAFIGTLIATAVVGAFDAVLMCAVPTFFVWTLAGALSPPVNGRVQLTRGVREFAPVVAAALALIFVGRSTAQLSAMSIFSTSTRASTLERASLLDPGSYRIHIRLAQTYGRGNCQRVRPHARAARRLLPNAGEPRRFIAMCGS